MQLNDLALFATGGGAVVVAFKALPTIIGWLIKARTALKAAEKVRVEESASVRTAEISGRWDVERTAVSDIKEIIPQLLEHQRSQDAKIEAQNAKIEVLKTAIDKCEHERDKSETQHADKMRDLRIEHEQVVQALVLNANAMETTFNALVSEFGAYRSRHPSTPPETK